MAQRRLVNEARRALAQQGIAVFSPLHDVGHGSADEVVPADLDALRDCAAVFAIVDGVDAGTLFEVGYATARGTPVVAFVQNEHAEALKMLEGSDCTICDDFTSAVYRTVWAALKL
jgi:nucleoside 2-deoxyribosyltransferase